MITRVKIANYKSLEQVEFDTSRVNVFIGEPNSGKSNLLEALAWLSPRVPQMAHDLFRLEIAADLFFDRELERLIQVELTGVGDWSLKFARDTNQFIGGWNAANKKTRATVSKNGSAESSPAESSPIRFYRYRMFSRGSSGIYAGLLPPFGANLDNLLYTNRSVRDSVSAFFKEKGYRLELRPQNHEILMSKEVDDILYSFPLQSISETMQRIVFYKAALESNSDAVLVLDEPEAHTFPFYTKYLAERIALDTTNQFFLTTHNPYVLMSIIEKTPSADLSIFATRMHKYRTEVHRLDESECAKALDMGMDLFLNLDEYFPE